MPARPVLQLALRLQNQPSGAEQAVAEEQRYTGEDGERREAVERCAGEFSSLDLEALDEGAEHDALREGRERRAVAEGVIPEGEMRGIAIAELEGDPAEDERQQHGEDREVDGGNDDCESERECRQQPDPAEHEPGLVAVPDGCDRVHDEIARGAVWREAVEDADAEIEAV